MLKCAGFDASVAVLAVERLLDLPKRQPASALQIAHRKNRTDVAVVIIGDIGQWPLRRGNQAVPQVDADGSRLSPVRASNSRIFHYRKDYGQSTMFVAPRGAEIFAGRK